MFIHGVRSLTFQAVVYNVCHALLTRHTNCFYAKYNSFLFVMHVLGSMHGRDIFDVLM